MAATPGAPTAPATTIPATAATAGIGSAHAPIPYRHEGGGLVASATGAMVVAGLLLGGLYAVLRIARQRGLLDRWIVATPSASAGATAHAPLTVERALRISPKTSVYRIRDGARRYLLVESLVQATLVPLPEEAHPTTPDDDVSEHAT